MRPGPPAGAGVARYWGAFAGHGSTAHVVRVQEKCVMPDALVLEAARTRLAGLESLALSPAPTPVHGLDELGAALATPVRLLVKRDDVLAFGFGGNKVRKLALVGAEARSEGADTLITTGGVQSNHARVTAAVAARLGMRCVLVLNGAPPAVLTGNTRLAHLLGAEVYYVHERTERAPEMARIAGRLRAAGRRPYVIPLGASTPLGALGFARGVAELLEQVPAPDLIVHSTSSGGTQAGLIAGCLLAGVPTRVLGISADDPAGSIEATVRELLAGMADLLGAPGVFDEGRIEVDDRFVGDGYGLPTQASSEAAERLARHEGVFLDPTYSAKAMAGLLAHLAEGRIAAGHTVVFWHTGGLPGLLA
jgi:1-aminocyclopropane-1-carboxylate deaminase/D-cysteine desulfhydrase-like pyridoxal-dependent ACC family enzyme